VGYHQKSTQSYYGQRRRSVLAEAEQKFSGPTLIGTSVAECHRGLAHLRIELSLPVIVQFIYYFFSSPTYAKTVDITAVHKLCEVDAGSTVPTQVARCLLEG